jgi:hypothetical protein
MRDKTSRANLGRWGVFFSEIETFKTSNLRRSAMFRYFSIAVLGFAGLSLASPQFSQAQTPIGVQVQAGPVGVSVQPGYTVVAPPQVVLAPQPVVVGPSIVVGGPVLAPWFWDGHHWIRRDLRVYRPIHYGYRR